MSTKKTKLDKGSGSSVDERKGMMTLDVPHIVFLAIYGLTHEPLNETLKNLGCEMNPKNGACCYGAAVRIIESLDLPRFYRFERLTPEERRRRQRSRDKGEGKRARWRRWVENNKEAHAAMRRRQEAKPISRLRNAMRRRMQRWVAAGKLAPTTRVHELLGCTAAELHAHITSTFETWMTWENYGRAWEIDHTRPCASFDLMYPVQARECFNWKNLAAKCKKENRRKGSFWEGKRWRSV